MAGFFTLGDEAIAASMGQPTKGRFGRGWQNLKTGGRDLIGGIGDAMFGPQAQPQQPQAQAQNQAQAKPETPQAQPQKAQKQADQPDLDDIVGVAAKQVNGREVLVLTFKDGLRMRQKMEDMSFEQLFAASQKARDQGLRRRIQAALSMKDPRRYEIFRKAWEIRKGPRKR